MFLYNLRITVRNFLRNKLFSAINIIGFSLGLAGTLLILLWIFNEISYDRFYENSDSIYLLVNKNFDNQGNSIDYVESPPPMADYLVNNFPEIKKAARVEYFYNGGLIQTDDNIYKERGAAVDESFLDIFGIEILKGNKDNIFDNPGSIIISESLAKKYFGNPNPIGKNLKVKGYGDKYKNAVIEGVYQNFPDNSTIKFDFIIPFSLEEKLYSDNWNVAIYATFVLLNKNVDYHQINNKVSSIYKKVINDNQSASYLYPFKKLHLYSSLKIFNNVNQGNIRFIYIMSFIASLILFIACINYMNLATARSIKKRREFSIKKMLGANQRTIIKEFLTETIFYSIISLHLAIIIVELVRPTFNNITGKNIVINYLDPHFYLSALTIILFISLISSLYPLIFLRSYQNKLALREGSMNTKSRKDLINYAKKFLVFFQFSISIILIIVSGIVLKQMDYIFSKDLGFDKENMIVIYASDLDDKESVFKTEILKNTNVSSVSIGKTPFGGGWPDLWSWEGGNKKSKLDVIRIYTDSDYLNTLDIDLLKGRFFKKGFSDRDNIVVNKTFASLIGQNNVIGKDIYFRDRKFKIIGITNDFYSHHFSESLKPVAFFNEPTHKFLVKVKGDNIENTANYIKSVYEKIIPDRPFEYTTLKNQFNNLYQKEVRTSKLFSYFSLLAIFISCLGLFGISVFAAEQRIKEIGIRKVLGASTMRIIRMLNLEFIKIVLVAYIISCPIAYYFAKKWLQNFYYRTELSCWIFLLAGVFIFSISILTISWYSLKSARKNPVDSLRYE